MKRQTGLRIVKITLFFFALAWAASACNLHSRYSSMERLHVQFPTGTPSETIPPATPLASLTPSQTLKPPPTFEPPTATWTPSQAPTVTPTPTLDLRVNIPGLNGAETATPSSTPGCELRDDWGLRYTVQPNDALAKIAQTYNTTVQELVAANCLSNPDVIQIGQELRVPGAAHPAQPEVECVGWELLTPLNGTLAVEGDGTLTFNWRGPRAPRNLIRIHKPDGGIVEFVLELRQNETIDLYEMLPASGTYTWYVYPLNSGFQQVCPEGGPWTFTKGQAPTPTLTPTDFPQQEPQPTQPPQVIVVTATPRPPRPTAIPTDAPTALPTEPPPETTGSPAA